MTGLLPIRALAALLLLVWLSTAAGQAAEFGPLLLPEQKRLPIRPPDRLPQVSPRAVPPPATVAQPPREIPERPFPLDAAIDLALSNSEVVRVLSGVTASTSGRSIYDVAITNTQIDQERATFDPQLEANNRWNRDENPTAAFDPLDPSQAILSGTRTDGQAFDLNLSQRNQLGGTARL